MLQTEQCGHAGCSCGGGESSANVRESIDSGTEEANADEVDVWRLPQENVRRTAAYRRKSVIFCVAI